jgi:3-isopropylmalate dehydrogenase
MEARVCVLAGDGVGKEVTTESMKVLEAICKKFEHNFEFIHALVGGAAIDKFNNPIPSESMNLALGSDAILFGAVGGPKWDNPSADMRPEDAILALRKRLGLYANMRPVKVYPELIHASPLKPEYLVDVDFVIVRELTGGLYFGRPKRRSASTRGRRAVDTLAYSEKEIARVVRVAFELAKSRRKRLHSLDKMNVLETGRLWREIANEVSRDYPEVELIHMLADNAAMKIITNPSDFDVIVAENSIGDILSDEASVITGSMGMLPSASLASSPPPPGKRRGRRGRPALYEPIHGSAPDIAGHNVANPVASFLSASLMLRWSFGLHEEADEIENAIDKIISEGYRTVDIAGENDHKLSTSQMGDLVAGIISSGPKT